MRLIDEKVSKVPAVVGRTCDTGLLSAWLTKFWVKQTRISVLSPTYYVDDSLVSVGLRGSNYHWRGIFFLLNCIPVSYMKWGDKVKSAMCHQVKTLWRWQSCKWTYLVVETIPSLPVVVLFEMNSTLALLCVLWELPAGKNLIPTSLFTTIHPFDWIWPCSCHLRVLFSFLFIEFGQSLFPSTQVVPVVFPSDEILIMLFVTYSIFNLSSSSRVDSGIDCICVGGENS